MKFDLQTLTEYSDDAILAELRRVADALDGARLTQARFNSQGRVHSDTVRNHFGSWPAALDRAGIDESVAPRPKRLTRDSVLDAIRRFASANPGHSITQRSIAKSLGVGCDFRRFGGWQSLMHDVGLKPSPLGRRYTDEECFENMLSLWVHYGRQPRFGELRRPPSTVGPKAYVRRWNGWRRALAAFVTRANQPSVEISPDDDAPVSSAKQTRKPRSDAPRPLSLSLRWRILMRDGCRCVICGRSPARGDDVHLEVDHIIPQSRGGLNAESNLRILCSHCNLGKGAKRDEE
jgi:5-methylcytosine-specific restriction endonuclease McrA